MYRTALVIAALALAVAACGDNAATDTSTTPTTVESATTTTAPPTTSTTTTTTVPATTSSTTSSTTTTMALPDAMTLRHAFDPGVVYTYDLVEVLSQTMAFEAAGIPIDELPGEIGMDMRLDGTVRWQASEEGDGLHRISFSMEYESVDGVMTADEETIPLDDLGLAAELSSIPIELTMVVDDQGNVVEFGFEGPEGEAIDLTSLLGLFGGSDAMTTPDFGLGAGPLAIPAFPEDAVEVGTTWDVAVSVELIGQTLDTETTYEITAVEGGEVTIDAAATTSGFTFTLNDLIELLQGLAPAERADLFEVPFSDEELDALRDEFDMVMTLESSDARSTFVFDVARGITTYSQVTTSQVMTVEMSGADPDTGEQFEMSFNVDQDILIETTLLEQAA